MSNKKEKEYISHYELTHLFATNRYRKRIKSGNGKMKIENNTLYYGVAAVAKILSYKHKQVIIVDGLTSGGWGNSVGTWYIKSAFKHWNIMLVHEIPTYQKRTMKEHAESSIKVVITNYINRLGEQFAVLNDYKKTSREDSKYGLNDLKDNVSNIIKFYNLSSATVLNFKIKDTFYPHWYKGWSEQTEYVKTDTTVRELLKGYFTEKEAHEIDMNKWIHDIYYGLGSHLSRAEKEANYNDPIKRAEETKLHEQYVKAREDRIKAERVIEASKKLDKWLKYELNYTYYLHNIPVHLRLSKSGENVETTMNADVPVKHAKLLYLTFKRCMVNDKEFISHGHTIKVGHYKVKHIKKDEDDNWFLKAGCHTIYWKEIELFVNTFKPEWNNH